MSEAEIITVSEAEDGQRLDRWLKKQIPFALAQKLIRKGAIRVDGRKVDADMRISAGQKVRLPALDTKPPKTEKPLSDEEIDLMHSLVLYDDGDLVVIDKPYDIAAQGGEGVKEHIDRLCKALPNKEGLTPRLVHRLDKETSGLMVLARSAQAVRGLGRMLRDHKIRKIYWALTMPAPEDNEGIIEGDIGKSGKKGVMMIGGKDAKKAVTDFAVLERAGKEIAFIAFWPRTGRTHQIRVHAAQALGAPIIGDYKYNAPDRIESIDVAARLHLHARRLIFHHPVSGKIIDLTAPLPPDLEKSWKAFNFNPDDATDPFEDLVI